MFFYHLYKGKQLLWFPDNIPFQTTQNGQNSILLILLHSERPKLYTLNPIALRMAKTILLTLLHSEWPKLHTQNGQNSILLTLLYSEWPKFYGVLAILSAIG